MNLSFGQFDFLVFVVGAQFDLQTTVHLGADLRLENNLANSRQNLDDLGRLRSRFALGQNSNGNLSGAILEEQVHAVVHLVVVGVVVEGADVGWLDAAGSGGLVVGQLLENVLARAVAKAHGNDSLGGLGKADVLDDPFLSGTFNLELSLISSAADVKDNLELFGGADGGVLVDADLADEVGLDVFFDDESSGQLVKLLGKFDTQRDLVGGGSLVADLHAGGREDVVLLFVLGAFDVFGGLADGLLLFLALLHDALEGGLLQVVLATALDLSLDLHLQFLFQELLGVPMVADSGVDNLSFNGDLVIGRLVGNFNFSSSKVLDNESVFLGGLAERNGSLNAELAGTSLDGSLDVQPVELAVVAHLLQLLPQRVDVVNASLAGLSLVLATVGADSVVGFADLEGLFADLGGLLALLAILFAIEGNALADLLGLSGNGFQIVEVLFAALDFVAVVAGLADLLDHFFVSLVDLNLLVVLILLSLSCEN